MAKTECNTNQYEYFYSHAHDTNADWDDPTRAGSSYVMLLLACEANGGGYSTTDGSVIRYDLMDSGDPMDSRDPSRKAAMDFPLHDAGDFDSITNVWVHMILTVSPSQLITYADGVGVADTQYGHFDADTPSNNVALTNTCATSLDQADGLCVTPRQLSSPLRGFNLT